MAGCRSTEVDMHCGEVGGMWGSRVLALLGSQDSAGSWWVGDGGQGPLCPSWGLPLPQPSQAWWGFSHTQYCPVSAA